MMIKQKMILWLYNHYLVTTTCRDQWNVNPARVVRQTASFDILEIIHFRSKYWNDTFFEGKTACMWFDKVLLPYAAANMVEPELRMRDSHCVAHRHHVLTSPALSQTHVERMRTLMTFASNLFLTRLTSSARASPFRCHTVSMSDAMSQRMIWVDLEVSQKKKKKNDSSLPQAERNGNQRCHALGVYLCSECTLCGVCPAVLALAWWTVHSRGQATRRLESGAASGHSLPASCARTRHYGDRGAVEVTPRLRVTTSETIECAVWRTDIYTGKIHLKKKISNFQ